MGYKVRIAVLVAAVSCLSIPSFGQGQEALQFSLRSETGLVGAFLDPQDKRAVRFDASAEGGMLTLRLDLYGQSVTLRRGQGELHIDSSNNTARGFSTLSDEERQVLRRLAASLGQGLENQSAFDASVICMMRNLGSWPADMPLFVSVDPLMTTVGDVSVPTAEIREARRLAMDDLRVQFPGDEVGISEKAITSFCSSIGKSKTACYPTSLIPYREKCENVLVGGTTCRGRCGTTCNGLCTQQRYTQDCHSHDRCADVYGIAHRYCNFIFGSTFDDCARAADCVDLPGVWTLNFTWAGAQPGTTSLNVDPKRSFTTGDGSAGTWSATDTSAKFTYSNGCKPTYTGTLSANRLTASGTMRCTTGSGSGTWRASKTNGILPAMNGTQTSDPAVAVEGPGNSSSRPD